jgi:hypothetical protein
MKVGDLVLPDFPEHRADWRDDWPDDMTGVIVEETKWNTYVVVTSLRTKEVNIEYLVKVINESR